MTFGNIIKHFYKIFFSEFPRNQTIFQRIKEMHSDINPYFHQMRFKWVCDLLRDYLPIISKQSLAICPAWYSSILQLIIIITTLTWPAVGNSTQYTGSHYSNNYNNQKNTLELKPVMSTLQDLLLHLILLMNSFCCQCCGCCCCCCCIVAAPSLWVLGSFPDYFLMRQLVGWSFGCMCSKCQVSKRRSWLAGWFSRAFWHFR